MRSARTNPVSIAARFMQRLRRWASSSSRVFGRERSSGKSAASGPVLSVPFARILLAEARIEERAIGQRLVVDLAYFEEPAAVALHELIFVVPEVHELHVLLRRAVR